MRRTRTAAAAALAAVLALVPVVVIGAPAQAADTVRSYAICSGSSLCESGNLPILEAYGLMSAGGGTAATGATAAVAASGLSGTMGFGTVVAATGAAVGLGLLALHGVRPGMYVETDPGYVDPAQRPDGFSAASGVLTSTTFFGSGGASATVRVTPLSITGPAFGASGPLVMRVRYDVVATTYTASICRGPTVPEPRWSTSSRVDQSQNGWTLAVVSPGPVTALGVGPTCSGSSGSSVTMQYSGTVTQFGAISFGGGSAAWPTGWPVVGVLSYFPVGSPSYTAGVTAGYHGTLRTTLTCKNSAGEVYVIKTARVDAEQGDKLPVPAASCDAPSVAVRALVEYQADGTSSWVQVGDADASPMVTPLFDDYPNCLSAAGALTCELQLQRKDGTQWQTCGPLAEYCPSWVEEWSETPDTFRCRYGSYDVPIERCSAFRQPGTLLPNQGTDSSGAPAPVSPTDPAPEQLPNPVVDPATGNPLDSLIDVTGEAAPSDEGQACFPSGWGVLNPVSWVLMPVGCALRAAFIPSPGKVEQVKTQLREKWDASAPGVVTTGIVVAVGAMTAAVAAGDGCEGVTIDTSWLNSGAFSGAGLPNSFTMLNACPGSPLAPWATFSFWLITAAMIVLAIRVLPGMVGKVVNFGGVSG